MANVASLLARRFYHVGGSVAVPQKCRLAYIGEMFLVRVNVCVGECTMHRLSADIIDFILSICVILIFNCSCQFLLFLHLGYLCPHLIVYL